MNNMKLKNVKLITVFMLGMMLSMLESYANNNTPPTLIQGSVTGTTGTTAVYYVDDGSSYGTYGCPMFGVTSEGTIVAASEVGTRYEITISWTDFGTATISFFNECTGGLISTKTVTVSCSAGSVPDPVINLPGGPSCGPKTLAYTETPPAGITWYWQTSPTGTSTTNGTQTYVASTGGHYYVRAKSNCGGYWSTGYDGTDNAVVINSIPSAPPPPVATNNTCGNKTLSKNGSPLAGFNWYWQGTNPNGIDNSSPQATAATYAASIYGTNSYYLRTQNTTTGCWSATSTGASVTINTPPAPSPASFISCEWQAPYLTTGGIVGTLRWYNDQNVLVNTGSSYSLPATMSNGTYTYTVKNYASTCEGPGATITLQVGAASCDNQWNWTQEKTYGVNGDGSPKEVSSLRSYTDGLSNIIQRQTKSYTANQVFATQNIYDSYGKLTLSTLPAPINSSTFAYKHRFIMSSPTTVYSKSDFDLTTTTGASGEVNNPKPVVSTGPGSLGWYYSTANNLEPATPTTSYPYMRSWTEKIAVPKRSKSAGAGDMHRMGSNHEVLEQEMNFNKSELGHYFSLQTHFAALTTTPETNLIANSKATTTYGFSSSGGASLSNVTQGGQTYVKVDYLIPLSSMGAYPIEGTHTVVPGTTYKFRVKGYRSSSNTVYLMVKNVTNNTNISWASIALPQGSANENWVEASFTIPAGCTSIRVGVLWSGTPMSDSFYINDVMLYQTYTDSNLVYGTKQISTDQDGRKSVVFTDANGKTLATALVTSVTGTYPSQTFTYDNWTYYYYDDMSRLIAIVSPSGVNIASTAYPSFVTTYKYDHLGRIYEIGYPDKGTTKYVYSLDGIIRFSQTQEQRNSSPQRFSYTNYDYLNRLIESGEYTMSGSGYYVFETHNTIVPAGNSVLNIVENTGYTGVTRRNNNSTAVRYNDTTFVEYDTQALDYISDANHLSQSNTRGYISKTKSFNATTWFSYDEFGQIIWTKQSILGLGIKTIDYTYDNFGNITEVAYQKGQVDDFYHHYIYDNDQNLTEAFTSLDGISKTLRAKYYYYLHGPLKRVELATNVQGIDYVYNINGFLKAINNADPTKDLGGDGTNGFAPDVFGQTMHYYTNDYNASYIAGNQTFTGYNDQYSGALKGVSWHTPVDNNSQARTYAYTYDSRQQLTEAKFGDFQSGAFTPDASDAYKESVPSYDKNGNIQSLVRKGKGGATLGNYGYVYEPNTNKLDKVNHNSSLLVDYSYNSIGQMVQQTEGTNTMNVKYNAYGLVDYIAKPEADQNVVGEWSSGWSQEGLSTNAFDNLGASSIISESMNASALEDGKYQATKRVYHTAEIAKGASYTVSYNFDVTDGSPGGDQYQADLYVVLWSGSLRTYLWVRSFYEEINHSGTYTFTASNNFDKIGFVVVHPELKHYFIQFNNFDVTSNQTIVTRYIYDDHGNVIRRFDKADSVSKNTYYVYDAAGNPLAMYEQILPSNAIELIELPVYGSGRIASFKPQVNTYFYEINDHLGSVRAVIGTTDTDVYTATMESENTSSEEPPFKNITARRVVSVAANHTSSGNEAVRLNSSQPAGPTINLKVSPGDLINLETWAYYEAGSSYNSTINSSTMITAIASAFGGVSGAPGEAGQIFNSVNSALGSGGIGLGATGDPALPGAYICYMVFDVNKNFTGQGGYYRVTSAGNMAKELISIPQITVEQPGYIYVCVYNRSDSPNWVYFDDMKVSHAHSPVVAGADYFPYGLPMEGREITQEDYRWSYQGQYAEKDTTAGWNRFQLRMYDARFGRWLSVDPMSQYPSPYLAMGNTPNMSVDPNGGWSWLAAGGGAVVGGLIGYAITGDWKGIAIGAVAGGLIGGASFNIEKQRHWVSYGSGTRWGHWESSKHLVLNNFGSLTGKAISLTAPDVAKGVIHNISPVGIKIEGPSNPNLGPIYASAGSCCAGLYPLLDILVESPTGRAVTGAVVRGTARTAVGWGGALAEPTPVGEIVMTGVTIGIVAYEIYDALNAPQIHPVDAPWILSMTAAEWIAKYCKGSILREFPEEFLDMTLEEIERLAKAGNAKARKALKLLRDLRFRK